ncbi:hypothetical protein RvY_04494 [Ramazzottius varieornatus]|uniref:Uncharacterized protein n=1 Tax=Ramazzottius varieornatus TaxID=947166 RepID=A0A1D1USG3_RAMVA|nr:hypothetical protein RvY_04494 [Ramazzottius varieornatus]
MDKGNAQSRSKRRPRPTLDSPSRLHRRRSSVEAQPDTLSETSHNKRQHGRNKEASPTMASKTKKKPGHRVRRQTSDQEGQDSDTEVSQLASASVEQEYIRNTISLPAMNNTAEELLIDGFAIVSFLTKEDLDTFVREKEPRNIAVERQKQYIAKLQREAAESATHGVKRRKMGEEKSDNDPLQMEHSNGSSKRTSDKKRKSRSAKKILSNDTELDDGPSNVTGNISLLETDNETTAVKLEPCSVTDRNPTSSGGGSDGTGGRQDEENATATSKSSPPSTLLSLLASGPRREANLTPPAARQDFHQQSTVMTDANLDTTSTSISALRSLDNSNAGPEERKLDSPKQNPNDAHESTIVKTENSVSVGSFGITSATNRTDLTESSSSDTVSGSETKARSSPSSSQEPNLAAADSSQIPGSSSLPPSSSTSDLPETTATATDSAAPHRSHRDHHHHKEHKSHRDRNRHRDKDRDREKDRERDKDRDRSEKSENIPRPESHVSTKSDNPNHNPSATQRGFNPVIQSANPLSPHLFHSSNGAAAASSPFPPHPAAGLYGQHPSFQASPRWGMFSSAMMAPGMNMAGLQGNPMAMLGAAGFDRAPGFFGFPPFSSAMSGPGGLSLAGLGSAHSMMPSSMPSPFPPSMSGMNGLPGVTFPGMNGLTSSMGNSAATTAAAQSLAGNISAQITSTKKMGKWCAMHVRIAWEIYHHQQKSQQGSGQGSPESLKLGDFSSLTGQTKDLSLYAKISSSMPYGAAPNPTSGILPNFLSRPGVPNDLSSALLNQASAQRNLAASQSLPWPIRPPYFGMTGGPGMAGLSFPGGPMLPNRDMPMGASFSPDSWRRPMAFGGLASASPTAPQTNGPSSSSPEKKEPSSSEKKPEPSEVPREKRSLDETDRESGSSSSSSKKKRTAESSSRSSNSDVKRESPKENRSSSEREKKHDGTPSKESSSSNKDSRKSTERSSKVPDRSSATTSPATFAHSKAIDLRRSDPLTVANTPLSVPERTKSALPNFNSQSASLLPPTPGLPPSFPGDSPFPSFLGNQLTSSAMDRSSLFPSMPGFPPMWPGFDPLRSPFGADSLAAREMLQQYQRFRGASMGGLGMQPADFFRANPFAQMGQMDRERMNELMRYKNLTSGPLGPPPLFSPHLASFMRPQDSRTPGYPPLGALDAALNAPNGPLNTSSSSASEISRRTPTPAKGNNLSQGTKEESSKSTESKKEVLNGEKDAPTDLSKHRPKESQSGVKDSSSSSSNSATSNPKSSSRSSSDRGSNGSHRHGSPNDTAAVPAKVDKEKA